MNDFAAARADLFTRIAAGIEAGLNPPEGAYDHRTEHADGTVFIHALLQVEHADDVKAWARHFGTPVSPDFPPDPVEQPRETVFISGGVPHRMLRVRAFLSPNRYVIVQFFGSVGGAE